MEHDHLSQEESANSPFVVCSIYTRNSKILDERRLIMDTKKIGAFIAMNRKKKGYTQEQLAEKLGVTNKTISRWENGHYMPDLSLLEPLSKELDITLNELLAGEEIIKEEAMEYSEQNLIQTIDYTDKKIKNEHKKISLFIIGIGIFTSLCAFTVFPSESSWGSIYSMIGLFLFVVGIFRELKITSLLKKGLISTILFILLLGIFFIFDYASVSQFKQPPIYRLTTTTVFSDDGNKMIEYQNPFYNVFRINADTPNEYYLIDNKRQYTIDTVPTSPFNVDKSSFEQLKKYKSLQLYLDLKQDRLMLGTCGSGTDLYDFLQHFLNRKLENPYTHLGGHSGT